jgi:Fanconi anemia group M protein
MENGTVIIADHREKQSGIPELLMKKGAELTYQSLKAGDYFINGATLIERKTDRDFVQSLIEGRLFDQCRKLRESGHSGLLIVEGNLATNDRRISAEALNAALLSVMVSWQIPIYFSSGKDETASAFLRIGGFQNKSMKQEVLRGSSNKKCHGSQIFFLQSLPTVGPKMALKLLNHFGTLERIATAGVSELKAVEGVGKNKAEFIFQFFRKDYSK